MQGSSLNHPQYVVGASANSAHGYRPWENRELGDGSVKAPTKPQAVAPL